MAANQPTVAEADPRKSENSNEFLKLKIKVYNITCPQHPSHIQRNIFEEFSKIELSELYDNQAIIKELQTSTFIGYATIFIMINYKCQCLKQELTQILTNFHENEQHLRYITKILYLGYPLRLKLTTGIFEDNRNNYLKYYFTRVKNANNMIKPATNLLEDMAYNKDNLSTFEKDIIQLAIKDYEIYAELFNIDNLLLIQYLTYGQFEVSDELFMLFQLLKMYNLISVQECLDTTISFKGTSVNKNLAIAQTFANADLYFYNINPAIAIIINNTFLNTQGHSLRYGGNKDVLKLCNTFKISKTLHFELNNLSTEELKQTMIWLSESNFKPFKNIFIFIMSHGNENGLIYSETGDQIYLQDIVDNLKKTKCAKDSFKYIFVTACRGTEHPDWVDLDDIEDYELDIEQNMAVFLSTLEGCVSYRDRLTGTLYIDKVSKTLRKAQHNDNILETIKSREFENLYTDYKVKDETQYFPLHKQTLPITKEIQHNIQQIKTNLLQTVASSIETNESLCYSAYGKEFLISNNYQFEGNINNVCIENQEFVFENLKPFENATDLFAFELELKFVPNYAKNLKNFFKTTSSKKDCKSFVETNLSLILNDNLAKQCQWKVSENLNLIAINNLIFINILWQIIKNEFQITQKKIFVNICQNWLNKSQQRIVKLLIMDKLKRIPQINEEFLNFANVVVNFLNITSIFKQHKFFSAHQQKLLQNSVHKFNTEDTLTCREFLQKYAPFQTLAGLELFEYNLTTVKNYEQDLKEIFKKFIPGARFNNDYATAIEESLSIILSNALTVKYQCELNEFFYKFKTIQILKQLVAELYKTTEQNVDTICNNWLENSKNRILKACLLKKLLYISLDSLDDIQELNEILLSSSQCIEILKQQYTSIPSKYLKDYNHFIALWYIAPLNFLSSDDTTCPELKISIRNNLGSIYQDKHLYYFEFQQFYKWNITKVNQFFMLNDSIRLMHDFQWIFDFYFLLGLTTNKDPKLFVQQLWLKLINKNILHKFSWLPKIEDININSIKSLKIADKLAEFFYTHFQISKEMNIFEKLSQDFFDNFSKRKKYFGIKEIPLETFDHILEYEEILKYSPQAKKKLKRFITLLWCEQATVDDNIINLINKIINIPYLINYGLYPNQQFNANQIKTFESSSTIQILYEIVNKKQPNITQNKFNLIIQNSFNPAKKFIIHTNAVEYFIENTPFKTLHTLENCDLLFRNKDNNDFKSLYQYFQYFCLNSYNSNNEFFINNIWCEIIDDSLLNDIVLTNLLSLNITKALELAFENKCSSQENKFIDLTNYWFNRDRIQLAELIDCMPFSTKQQLLEFDSYLLKSNYSYQYCYNFFKHYSPFNKNFADFFKISNILDIPQLWDFVISEDLFSKCIWKTIRTDKSLLRDKENVIINDLHLIKMFECIYDPLELQNISQSIFSYNF